MTVLQRLLSESSVSSILENVLAGEKLTFNQAVELMKSSEIDLIGLVADKVRRKQVGNRVTFVINWNLNYTNVCIARCPLCAFYTPSKKTEKAYTLNLEGILKAVGEAAALGATEVHIVGGHNPELNLEYYETMFREIKKHSPQITIKALTMAEIDFIAKLTKNTVKELLSRLHEAGLDVLAGGGAEIFHDEVRSLLSPWKVGGDGWLEIAETAHRLGIRSNSTMLYGHVEKPEHRIDHMMKIRALQERTGGLLSFIPLKFNPGNTELLEKGLVKHETSGLDDLKVIAISRLLLGDVLPNISVYWIAMGKRMAQVGLSYGGSDLVGTAFSEKIFKATGERDPTSVEELVHLIREAAYIPAQRDTFYNIIRDWC